MGILGKGIPADIRNEKNIGMGILLPYKWQNCPTKVALKDTNW